MQWAYHLILPGIVFGAGLGAMYARTTRATVLDALHEDQVRTARAKGLSESRVVRHHVFPNAFGPLATMLTVDLGALFGGTVFVEEVFNIPGLGRLALSAFNRSDLSLLLGVTITVSLLAVVASLLVDVVLTFVSPPKAESALKPPGLGVARATSDPRSPPSPPYR